MSAIWIEILQIWGWKCVQKSTGTLLHHQIQFKRNLFPFEVIWFIHEVFYFKAVNSSIQMSSLFWTFCLVFRYWTVEEWLTISSNVLSLVLISPYKLECTYIIEVLEKIRFENLEKFCFVTLPPAFTEECLSQKIDNFTSSISSSRYFFEVPIICGSSQQVRIEILIGWSKFVHIWMLSSVLQNLQIQSQ